MNQEKIGKLILKLRQEKKLTQKELAQKLNVSDKAVSKWECGYGIPDITLLEHISRVFDIPVKIILQGEIDQNKTDGGNMKKTNFYVCENCKNIITSTSNCEISCCSTNLKPLQPKAIDSEFNFEIQDLDGEYFITFESKMTKEDYVSFVSYICPDKVLTVRLYPEQSPHCYFPKLRGGKFYIYSVQKGLFQV